jgi:hypothetical protein
VQQISAVLIIILKYKIRLIERAPIITAKAVLVTTIRMTTMERILVVSEYKKGSKDGYYRLY